MVEVLIAVTALVGMALLELGLQAYERRRREAHERYVTAALAELGIPAAPRRTTP